MADSVLLHCLLTCAFEVTLTTTSFLLVPHSVLYLLKINFIDAKKNQNFKLEVLDKMDETWIKLSSNLIWHYTTLW